MTGMAAHGLGKTYSMGKIHVTVLHDVDFSLSNLWKRKLRTFLTTFGVVIGIGALVAMVSFGKGIQRNVMEGFRALELFNYITVFSGSFDQFISGRSGTGGMAQPQSVCAAAVPLDDAALLQNPTPIQMSLVTQ